MLSVSRTSFELSLDGLTPSSDETILAINEAVDEHLRSLELFQVGLSSLPRRDRIIPGAVAGIAHSIAHAKGALLSGVIVTKTGAATGIYPLSRGEKAKLGY